MKKKDKELDSVSIFYEKTIFNLTIYALIPVFVLYCFLMRDESTFDKIFEIGSMALILVIVLVIYAQKRVIDSEGVSQTLFGIRLKRIRWSEMYKYVIEYRYPKPSTNRPWNYRNMLVFTAKSMYGKKVIMMDATDEAVALAEKYFGPPAYVQEGVSAEEEK